MSKVRVGVVHTFLYSVEDLKKLFAEILPEVEMINIIDDSLLNEVLANGGPTPGVIRRICQYALHLESLGCKCILNQCSSVGEVADIAQKMIGIPYVKVDQPMGEIAIKAALKGKKKVGVVATAYTTMGPSSRLVESTAKSLGATDVVVSKCFAEGAYDALLKEGNKARHDEILMRTIKEAAAANDAVVLAQGSMMSLLPSVQNLGVPVVCSFRTGVEQIRKVLNFD
jgi:aspartate/glutamate racemase